MVIVRRRLDGEPGLVASISMHPGLPKLGVDGVVTVLAALVLRSLETPAVEDRSLRLSDNS